MKFVLLEKVRFVLNLLKQTVNGNWIRCQINHVYSHTFQLLLDKTASRLDTENSEKTTFSD